MSMRTWWWLGHCRKCQARESFRKSDGFVHYLPLRSVKVRVPTGAAISVEYLGPLSVAPRGNTYYYAPFFMGYFNL